MQGSVNLRVENLRKWGQKEEIQDNCRQYWRIIAIYLVFMTVLGICLGLLRYSIARQTELKQDGS